MARPIRVAAIIKVTENCNYNCDFCFYAKKHYDWKKTMTIDMCKDIIRKTSDYNYANGVKKSNIIFHGGELDLGQVFRHIFSTNLYIFSSFAWELL